MSIEKEYNGKTYKRNGSKWVDDSNMVVPTYLQNILNTLLYQQQDVSDMSYDAAKREGDKAKKSESFTLAIKYYRQAIDEADNYSQIAYILPRISSCYRKNNQPRKVIELLADMKEQYGEGIINEALLTSAAAAYCDLGEPHNAIKCCKWAYKVLKIKTDDYSIELSNVFERANRMIDPEYDREEELLKAEERINSELFI